MHDTITDYLQGSCEATQDLTVMQRCHMHVQPCACQTPAVRRSACADAVLQAFTASSSMISVQSVSKRALRASGSAHEGTIQACPALAMGQHLAVARFQAKFAQS